MLWYVDGLMEWCDWHQWHQYTFMHADIVVCPTGVVI